ncbi:MAG: tetratricopeptide repeat protein [Myxococcota bacterium]
MALLRLHFFRRFFFIVALGTLFFAGLAPPSASAQEDARARFSAGVRLFDAGRYGDALEAFRDAYRIQPHPSVLVNMANCYVGLDRPLEALELFREYLAEEDVPPETRGEIETAVRNAESQLGRIEILAPVGIDVYVDGDRRGQSPVAAVSVNPGPHVVEFLRADRATRSERVEVPVGQTVTVDIRPPGSSDTPPLDTTAPPPPQEEESGGGIPLKPVLTLSLAGASVVSAILGVVFGVTALGQQSDFDAIADDIRSRNANDPEIQMLRIEAESIDDARSRNATLADVFFVTSALTGTAALLVLFLLPNSEDSDAPSVTLSPLPEPGLLLSGRF